MSPSHSTPEGLRGADGSSPRVTARVIIVVAVLRQPLDEKAVLFDELVCSGSLAV